MESLLALETAAEGFLAEPVGLGEGGSPGPAGAGLAPGTRVGPYRLVELLGRGGMGTVYRAPREDDFAKEVALKLVQRELASPFTLRRFHRERQILARLEHPNIARRLDGARRGRAGPARRWTTSRAFPSTATATSAGSPSVSGFSQMTPL